MTSISCSTDHAVNLTMDGIQNPLMQTHEYYLHSSRNAGYCDPTPTIHLPPNP
ncbi:hypothetical protein BCR44DRAFT_1423186 [Catenaria anguillulae PL171]|uniref:Uncharacterized protein n=1 Tax=Catenaria anguillulae PL171 TaxID=765915 RepID=A0A1Y2I412_9FUNG|nr:hypothetical protein BCR44DRAFT_1423186 [Catenaria anguillulae PL171]